MSINQNSSWSFPHAVNIAFLPFVLRHGLDILRADTDCVLFTSSHVQIEVAREYRSEHISVSVIRIDTKELFGLHELSALLTPEELRLASCCHCHDELQCCSCMKPIVDALLRIGDPLIIRDERVYSELRISVDNERQKYWSDAQFGPVIEKANAAWQNKEWFLALQLYRRSKQGLQPSELRRLDYLQKLSLAGGVARPEG